MNVTVPSALPSALSSQGTITEHTVDALAAGKDTVVWDRALTGFGVRVYPRIHIGPRAAARRGWPQRVRP